MSRNLFLKRFEIQIFIAIFWSLFLVTIRYQTLFIYLCYRDHLETILNICESILRGIPLLSHFLSFFSSKFIPNPNIKEIIFCIYHDYESEVFFEESDEAILPTITATLFKLPAVKTIEIHHTINLKGRPALTVIKRVDAPRNTYTALTLKKESAFIAFQNFDPKFVISLNSGTNGVYDEFCKVALTGKKWNFSEILCLSALITSSVLDGTLKLFVVDVKDEAVSEVKKFILSIVGDNFVVKKIESSLYFYYYVNAQE